ncbi:hypothetical protein [Paenibacillus ihumii]|uniref:hypothetical protein n=1 Tax=Paenibacillus ihumii TaxID=687436 RepID=UPI0006D7C3E0|nr:hypothetical protein [Paenibacillus ihumii]
MAKYVVEKDFRDRFNGHRHCRQGEAHVPPNEERAEQLLKQGFISVVEEKRDDEPKQEGRAAAGSKKTSSKQTKPGDENGEAAAGE